MLRKVVAAAAVSGSLIFGATVLVGTGGVVGASGPTTATTPAAGTGTTPATPANHATRCAKAEKLATLITKLEGNAATWLPKARGREAKATAAGNTAVATRISHRIVRVQKLETRGKARLAKISAKCGAPTS